MVRTNTLLKNVYEKKAFMFIAHEHTKLLKNPITFDSFLTFCYQMYPVNPKLFQHFLEVTYPKRLYSLDTLRRAYPELDIVDNNNNLFIDNALLITVLQGALLKKSPFFKGGRLIVLNPPEKKKDIDTTEAFLQTKQKFPDYIYYFNKKDNTWRYYDLKTGDLHVNQGHVVGVSNHENYETLCEYLITHQMKFYSTKMELQLFIKKLLDNAGLSWSERNVALQKFYLENLHKYPDINPSMVFKQELFYDIKDMKVPKFMEGIVNYNVISTKEETENAITAIIKTGGKQAIHNYLLEPNKNINIARVLGTLLNESIASLKDIV